MSTRSSARNLFPPLDNPELTIRRRSRTDPTLLNNSEMVAEGNGDLPVPDLRTIEELCQPSLNGRVHHSCQFHGLPGENANKHLDKFLHVTQSIKLNRVTDDALRLYLFPHPLTHHATAWLTNKLKQLLRTVKLVVVLIPSPIVQPSLARLKTYMLQEPTKGNNQGRNQFFEGANQGQNQPSAYQAPVYQAPVHKPQIPQPQVVTTNEFTNLIKANTAILKNMQTNMTSLTNSNLELKNMFGQFIKMNTTSSLGLGTPLGNTITNPKEDLKGITTRSETAYQGLMIPTTSSSPVVECETEMTKDMVHPTNNGSTNDVQPSVVLTKSLILNSELVISPIIEPVASPVSAPKPNLRPSIPYLSRLHDQKLSLADLGASFNLMPFSVWNKLSLPDLSPTCMTLELVDRSITRPVGVSEDVFVKVGTFYFPADFVDVDFDADPRVPLILRRSFFKTERALIDEFEGELTLCVGKEAITFNLDQTLRYSANYNDMTAKQINVIDMACEEYSQEVLSFFDVITSGNPTPYYDLIVSTTSLTLTPFGESDFLLEEVDAFIALEDDPTSPKVDQPYVDT
nr:reverse transcriptase domain-containing protein [Tanacetum cinerariifolium]